VDNLYLAVGSPYLSSGYRLYVPDRPERLPVRLVLFLAPALSACSYSCIAPFMVCSPNVALAISDTTTGMSFFDNLQCQGLGSACVPVSSQDCLGQVPPQIYFRSQVKHGEMGLLVIGSKEGGAHAGFVEDGVDRNSDNSFSPSNSWQSERQPYAL
jgi:hypothetical protein